MTNDVARFEANERVDLDDMLFVVDESLRANARHAGEAFYVNPTKQRSWVVDGFTMSLPVASQVQVTLGRAILAQREGGQVLYGAIAAEGDAQRIVDVSTYSNGSYDIYIRLEMIDGESASRAFWNPQGLGSEIAQTIPTRRLANWSVRIELTNPGAEWLKIGEVTVTGGVASGLLDRRPFYFEGTPGVGAGYESGWSDDGGGVAIDRNSNRASYGVKDLQTFTGAMRQCIEDIKGRGIRRWWEKDIGGMNINLDTDPQEGRIAITDVWFHLDDGAGTAPRITWDEYDKIEYDRALNQWEYYIGSGNNVMNVKATGLSVLEGMTVGFDGTPADDILAVGDANFGLDFTTATNPRLFFNYGGALGDCYIEVDRTIARMNFELGGGLEGYFTTSGLTVTGGMDVGFASTPLADQVRVGDENFGLHLSGSVPYLYFDKGNNDFLAYNRTLNKLNFFINNVWLASWGSAGLNLLDGLTVGYTGDAPFDGVFIGDNDFVIYNNAGADAIIKFDTQDSLIYDRGANELLFNIGGSTVFNWQLSGSDPVLAWAPNDYLYYDVSENELKFETGGTPVFRMGANAKPLVQIYHPLLSPVDSVSNPIAFPGTACPNSQFTIPVAEFIPGRRYRVTCGGSAVRGSATAMGIAFRWASTTQIIAYSASPPTSGEWAATVDFTIRLYDSGNLYTIHYYYGFWSGGVPELQGGGLGITLSIPLVCQLYAFATGSSGTTTAVNYFAVDHVTA